MNKVIKNQTTECSETATGVNSVTICPYGREGTLKGSALYFTDALMLQELETVITVVCNDLYFKETI